MKPLEERQFELERGKLEEDIRLRTEALELRRERWTASTRRRPASGLKVATIAAAAAVFGATLSSIIEWHVERGKLDLEDKKFRHAKVLSALRGDPIDRKIVAENLNFLVQAGLLEDEDKLLVGEVTPWLPVGGEADAQSTYGPFDQIVLVHAFATIAKNDSRGSVAIQIRHDEDSDWDVLASQSGSYKGDSYVPETTVLAIVPVGFEWKVALGGAATLNNARFIALSSAVVATERTAVSTE